MRIGTHLVSASKALTRTERLSYGPTGLLEQRTNDQAPVYPVADGAGGLIAELGEQGQLEELPELDPWGAAADAPSPAGNIEDEKSFGFLGAAGRIAMPDSGITKLGARYYDAEVGAFLTVDPVVGEPAEPARRTPYIYGLSGPARFVDVDGRSAADAWKSAKKFVNEKASAVQERAAEITNDPNASWLSKASVVPIGLLSSLGSSENFDRTALELASLLPPVRGVRGLAIAGKAAKGGRVLSQAAKRRLAKQLGGIPRSATPIAQGGSSRVGRWWEYLDSNRKIKIVVEHTDGSVHVGVPKPHSTHHSGGPPKYYDVGNHGHVGGK